jgi:hypothetical protein
MLIGLSSKTVDIKKNNYIPAYVWMLGGVNALSLDFRALDMHAVWWSMIIAVPTGINKSSLGLLQGLGHALQAYRHPFLASFL